MEPQRRNLGTYCYAEDAHKHCREENLYSAALDADEGIRKAEEE